MGWWLAAACGLAGAQPAIPDPAPLALSAGATEILLQEQAHEWLDTQAAQGIDAVEAAAGTLPWRTVAPGRQLRIGDGALWVRFDVALRDASRWYVSIGASGLDRAQLYHRDAAGRWVVQEAGDTLPVSQWPLPGRAPTFELSQEPGSVVRYWLRIEHQRVSFAAPIVLRSHPRLLQVRDREQFLLGAYFGLAFLVTVVALANGIGWRDRNFVAYAVYVAALTAGQAAYLGVGAQHLWEPWLAWNRMATLVLPGLSAAAALWFVQVVTEPARFSHRLNRVVWAVIALLLAAVTWEALRPSTLSLQALLGLTVMALVLVALLIALVWTQGDDPHIRLIALGFLPVLVMAVFPVARGFDLIPNSIFTRYGLSIGAALEMPILFYALSLRASRRREAQLRASALPHTDALTGLADRRHLLQRLDASLQRARSQRHACGLLVAKLVNHEAITSEYGRETMDRALVVAASHLRRAATDIDLAARVGEREFALVLEGPASTGAAIARAQQIVASGLRQDAALPAGLTLRFQVMLALLPDQQGDAAGHLRWILEALAAMRPDSRKQIRALNF